MAMIAAAWRGALLAALLLSAPVAYAGQGFDAFRQSIAQEAAAAGVDPALADRALGGASFDPRVVQWDRKQPEHHITLARYLKNTLSAQRVKRGRSLRARNAAILAQVERRYGVPSGVILALWGIESDFGAMTGGFDVVSALASLAYEGRRATFFKEELIQSLLILQEENMSPRALTGSWAGALGQCQFMPSTYRRYAVDADGDGRRDIWDSTPDALASMAHYLRGIGWTPGMAMGREVRVKGSISAAHTGLGVQKTLAEWGRFGVVSLGGKALPALPIQASLIRPDGPKGRSFLVYDNFRTVMRWNRSTYFAVAVMLLADRLSNAS